MKHRVKADAPRSPGEILEGRALAVNEYLATENERVREQVRRDAEEFDELRLKRDEVIREREYERREAKARLDEALQRAEKGEARVAALEAELGEGVLGRLRALCRGVRTTLQTHWPGAGGW
jgi:hypothetical protein